MIKPFDFETLLRVAFYQIRAYKESIFNHYFYTKYLYNFIKLYKGVTLC